MVKVVRKTFLNKQSLNTKASSKPSLSTSKGQNIITKVCVIDVNLSQYLSRADMLHHHAGMTMGILSPNQIGPRCQCEDVVHGCRKVQNMNK